MSSLTLSVMSPEFHMCKGSQCHLLSGRHFVRCLPPLSFGSFEWF